ncbi:MAG: 5'-nucleotidase C-terminal domain-containing protein [Chloroflexi bacterium]|uniref:bifunctional metallophosphatase/5'-nucleotidase n=1 Tax=Candidatus Flexifilum breve TaxID=3140694 RepID=UPI00313502A3|nr:5'-nucleotidase C-terminal domain-containing protein [Chloroflexota bacterium]
MVRRLTVLLLITGLCIGVIPMSAQSAFTLTVLHTNDTRANHLPDADDVGGAARAATVIKQLRDAVDNSLLVDAGGRFTGTLFHRVYAGQDNVQIMNALGYQAMVLGSPEFDNGDQTLAQFIRNVNFPVLGANIDASESDVLADLIQPSAIVDVNGTAVGVIGVTTADAPRVSSPGRDLIFSPDYRGSVQAQVDALTEQGINKIILLSYLGYDEDLALAPELRGVDLIVGGNTRTLLSNTDAEAAGPYPAVTAGADGAPILIVQSGGGARGELRFLGRIDLTFDAEGVLIDWSGDTILLASSIRPDPDIVALIDDLNEQVQIERARPVRTLTGEQVLVAADYTVDDCRIRECELGNLVADGLRWRMGTDLALVNGGSMRGGLASGALTRGSILEFLPFSNRVSTFRVRGSDLVLALENGVSRVGESSGTGRFPQISGLRYSYDLSQPVFSRIVSVEMLSADGTSYEPLDPNALYTIATNDFMRKGGDGYQVFADRGIDAIDTTVFFDDVFESYVREHSPLSPTLEDRITLVESAETTPTPGS